MNQEQEPHEQPGRQEQSPSHEQEDLPHWQG